LCVLNFQVGKLELAELFAKYTAQIENSKQENGRMTKELFTQALRELLNVELEENSGVLERYYSRFGF